MILTDDCVFLHMPKTGGTFVASMLEQLYPRGIARWRDRLGGRPPLGRPARSPAHKHASRSSIPPTHRHLPILATIRSPYESYVSAYEFGEWRRGADRSEFQGYDWKRIEREFPQFPDIDFATYLTVLGAVGYRRDVPDRPELGWRTVRVANQFTAAPAPDVRSPLAQITAAVRDGTADVRFIHTENLNVELYERLGDVGVPAARREFILGAAKVLPTKGGRTAEQHWRRYYTDDLLERVTHMDAALLARFPEYTLTG